ncbi:hypothetical protein FQA47_020886 [Oryzias melastigma]|uniref:Uncharacterized protein n=1 Tax=Oryzias melastigma TaxID=30732 RepID=A0A834C3E2_ORYME|nr:hypothetical protein FQA47_020886 [Oryzias melastigma]
MCQDLSLWSDRRTGRDSTANRNTSLLPEPLGLPGPESAFFLRGSSSIFPWCSPLRGHRSERRAPIKLCSFISRTQMDEGGGGRTVREVSDDSRDGLEKTGDFLEDRRFRAARSARPAAHAERTAPLFLRAAPVHSRRLHAALRISERRRVDGAVRVCAAQGWGGGLLHGEHAPGST